jgi:hypothetical protein
MVASPKLKKGTKRTTTSIGKIHLEPSKSGPNLPSLSSISTKSKKKIGFLSAVSKLIIKTKINNQSIPLL